MHSLGDDGNRPVEPGNPSNRPDPTLRFERLAAAWDINAALARPEVRRIVEASGATVEKPNTSADAQAFYGREIERFETMARSTGQRKQ